MVKAISQNIHTHGSHFPPTMYSQAGKQQLCLGFDGAEGDTQPIRNLRIRSAGTDQDENICQPGCQPQSRKFSREQMTKLIRVERGSLRHTYELQASGRSRAGASMDMSIVPVCHP